MSETFYTDEIGKVIDAFDTDISTGISEEEVRIREEKYGKNVFETKKEKSIFLLFFAQFQNGLVYILLLAVGITFFIGEYFDASIILGVVILNAIIGVIQEYRAEKAMSALQKMSSPKAIVIRGGKTEEIPSEALVPGDIVILDTGRIIPADMRLIEGVNLTIDESILTGESLPEIKNTDAKLETKTPLADRENMAYMGTLVVAGRGKGVVIATGNRTEMGHIAKSLDEDEQPKTPLEIRIEGLSRLIGKLVIGICIALMILAYFQGRNLEDMFLISVSLAVASIPEGLVAIITIVLSIGVTQMARKNAIVRHLPAVETLGSVNVICSDKTGTLTRNQMTVTEFSVNPGEGIIVNKENGNGNAKLLAKAMVLASDATLENGESTGDPTEVALLQFADVLGDERHEYEKNTKRIRENPFDSERKCMSTLVKEGDTFTIYTKGSLTRILDISTHIRKGEEIIRLTKIHREKIMHDMEAMSGKALRVLAVAMCDAEAETPKDAMEKNLTFLGMVGMIDPPREEAKIAIEKAKNAGVTSIMITGDHAITAFAIAKTLGIAESEEQVITGEQLDSILENEENRKKFEKNIMTYRVYARVSPHHKVTIVKTLEKHGNIVSMTGDGVNDAPSLNIADIGIAMGITGTDVSKGASDMILADDNFATIVSAIEQGRNIYNNIKKSIIFLLTGNLGEVITMVIALAIGWESPLLATQLLWINLITDSLPAIALGMDTNDPKIMSAPPKNPKEGFFQKSTFGSILFYGILIGSVTLISYAVGMRLTENNLDYARSLAFITLIIAQLFFAFSIRSRSVTSFGLGFFTNIYLTFSLFISLGLQILLFSNSLTREMFHLVPLGITDWGVAFELGLIPFLVNEGRKMLRR